MIKSLYSGVTGLKTHNQRMDVIGNNIANVNTTAYKAGTVTFKDVYYQTKQSASSGSYTSGGINPKQTGYGVQLGTIGKVMTQSGLTYSDSVFDCALQGSGFFQVMDSSGNIYYTRSGRFDLDNFGNLVDPNGNVVLGVSGDPTGVTASGQRINISVPAIEDSAASETKYYLGYGITFEAGGYGQNGNIAITIVNSDVPFATMDGANSLTVYMDLNKDYEALAAVAVADGGIGPRPTAGEAAPAGSDPSLVQNDPVTAGDVARWERALAAKISELFSADLRDAIRLGGVNVDSVIYNPEDPNSGISVTFDSIPSATSVVSNPTAAQNASNSIAISDNLTLVFEMSKAGASGNAYEVNIKNTAPSGTVVVTWTDNVVTINIPSDGSVTLEQIQEELDNIAGVTRDADGNVTDSPIPARAINVSGYYTDADGDATELGTGDNLSGVATTGRGIEEYLDNRTLKMAMANGSDSFFASAFQSLTTVRMTGGANYTPQTPADCEIIINNDGVIYGIHAVHGTLALGRIDIVDFVNPNGLLQVGTSYYAESLNSGSPQLKTPATDTDTFIISGALEMSNVDLSQEFSDMIITQRGFQANSRIITVSDSMLEELVNLKR